MVRSVTSLSVPRPLLIRKRKKNGIAGNEKVFRSKKTRGTFSAGLTNILLVDVTVLKKGSMRAIVAGLSAKSLFANRYCVLQDEPGLHPCNGPTYSEAGTAGQWLRVLIPTTQKLTFQKSILKNPSFHTRWTPLKMPPPAAVFLTNRT